MKKLLFFLSLFTAIGVQAQTGSAIGNLRPEQFVGGSVGYIMIVGADGLYHTVPSPYLLTSDSSKYITPTALAVVGGKVPISQSFSGGNLITTLANGTTITTVLDGRYALLSSVGQANGIVPLGADLKISSIYLPNTTSTGNIFVDSTEAAMTGHTTAGIGDISKRVDLQKNLVLQALPASNAANWIELYQGNGIQFVNGLSGSNVNLSTDNIPEGVSGNSRYYTDARARAAISATNHLGWNNVTGLMTMQPSGVAAGTYNRITIDQFGIPTFAENVAYLTAADLVGYATISQLTTAGGIGIPAANIIGLPNPAGTESIEEFTNSTSSNITLAHTPISTSVVKIYQNGQLKKLSLRTVTGTSVTLGFTRIATDIITAQYNY